MDVGIDFKQLGTALCHEPMFVSIVEKEACGTVVITIRVRGLSEAQRRVHILTQVLGLYMYITSRTMVLD